MSVIGVRSTSKEIYYAILNGTINKPELEKFGKIDLKKLNDKESFNLSKALVSCHNIILELCKDNAVQNAYVKTTEPNARFMGNSSKETFIERCIVEGVIIEAIASSKSNVDFGPWKKVSSKLKKDPKLLVESDSYKVIPNWDKFKEQYREAILVGISCLNTS